MLKIILLVWVVTFLIWCPDKTKYRMRGPDPRVLAEAGAVLQNFFSWPLWWYHKPPVALKVWDDMVALPPFTALNVRYPFTNHWATFRMGHRYDVNGKIYLADVLIKLWEDGPLFF